MLCAVWQRAILGRFVGFAPFIVEVDARLRDFAPCPLFQMVRDRLNRGRQDAPAFKQQRFGLGKLALTDERLRQED